MLTEAKLSFLVMRTGDEVLVSVPVRTAFLSPKHDILREKSRIPSRIVSVIYEGKSLSKSAGHTPKE